MTDFLKPHRIVMIAIAVALVLACIFLLNWSWLENPKYQTLILQGIWRTIWITIVTMVIGMLLAIPIGLAQAAGPWYLAVPARVFCTVIRGTPLLMQLWLLYYGLGSLFPSIPWIRESDLWPLLRQAWPYAVVALSLSVAGYEGEVMRGAFKGVPHGQLEAARAMGMPRFTALRRIWLPQAIHRVLPTIGGETVLQLKATPLVSTITVMEIYAVVGRIRQDTFIIYEPLLFLAAVYMCLTGLIVLLYRWFEGRMPKRVA
ncbi:ABC transporter permease [Tabrizicola sp. J26]|uniref:ABC transporter permease n=1 Tax=Alitabrizicola rongguiensis TaxID=2909234 RepID=UPI001F45C8D9|nr:ABC transporter permease [Tabrizicola rongguiensis]MCF1708649.1 ABC transporter permease [Tabrizicola rongguiensis]